MRGGPIVLGGMKRSSKVSAYEYVAKNYRLGARKVGSNVIIYDIIELDLQILVLKITCTTSLTSPHLTSKAQMDLEVRFLDSTLLSWC